METVLVAPIALLVLCGGIETGHYLYCEHQVLKGVRDAVRYASREPLGTWNCTAAKAEADLSTTNPAWQTIANVAVYGQVATGSRPRLWSWSAASAAGEVQIRYSCVAVTTGAYAGFAPKVVVIGKPDYASLFKALTGLDGTVSLYARQQALGIGI